MNIDLLDIIIVLLTIGMLIRGFQIGFIQQFFATAGFISGILLGAWLTSKIIKSNAAPSSRGILTLLITLGVGFLFLAIGEIVGGYIKGKITKKHWFDKIDASFGSILGGVSLLISVWLATAIFIKLPYQNIKSQIQQSTIVGSLNRHLPTAPSVVTKLGSLIDPNGFPQVFVGTEPAPASPVVVPSLASLQGIINSDSKSVVKIEGRGCGGIVLGSGFIADNNIVVTNAHVVAGVLNPVVEDTNGKHQTTVIWFDPSLDLAVIKTSGLAGAPLKIQTRVGARGQAGVVMGYPGGGSLTASPAAIMDEFIATGRNIYNQGSTDRDIYELQTDVQPGNSGGPFITSDGQVMGLVFAKSTVYDHVGYALAMKQVNSELQQAENDQVPTSTGACAEH